MAQEIDGWRHVGNGRWEFGGVAVFFQSAQERAKKGGKAGWVRKGGGPESLHATRDDAMNSVNPI